MTISKPNRTREQTTGSNESRQKQSGDQHILPIDEPLTDPHRPHRANRQDMQKTVNDQPDQDDSTR
jgi:hypothetical protein